MSINQKSGRQTFRRRFVSGSLFVSPCPPECNFQSETKIEPDLRLREVRRYYYYYYYYYHYYYYYYYYFSVGRDVIFVNVLERIQIHNLT